jgi:hypothetical protein
MTLSAAGVKLEARPRPITDPAKIRAVVDKFRAKYRFGQRE